jgi:hypothetical protein
VASALVLRESSGSRLACRKGCKWLKGQVVPTPLQRLSGMLLQISRPEKAVTSDSFRQVRGESGSTGFVSAALWYEDMRLVEDHKSLCKQ